MNFSGFVMSLLAMVFVIFSLYKGSSGQELSQELRNLSCTYTETQCALGCCPLYDAVCCVDGFECCPHGTVCIPLIGCFGIDNQPGQKKSLVTIKTTPVKGLVNVCPEETTECGEGCCSSPHATCCEDGLHCCPHDYKCDVSRQQCIKSYSEYSVSDSKGNLISGSRHPVKPTKKMTKAVPRVTHKSCPGDSRTCPKSQNCCVDDDGTWKCCSKPKPPLSVSNKATDNCCNTMWGYKCCGFGVLCTFLGCIP